MQSWFILAALLLVVILVPFFLLERDINAWVERVTQAGSHASVIAFVVIALLAIDVVLPVPSSIVITGAGAALGLLPGVVASTVGLTLGSIGGYAIGKKCGLPVVRRMVRERDLEQVSSQFRRSAMWAIAIMRPIPVLAEASALFSGVAAVPFSTYLFVTTLANAGIAAVYCTVGAYAAGRSAFLFAFAASIALPAAGMLVSAFLRRGGRRGL